MARLNVTSRSAVYAASSCNLMRGRENPRFFEYSKHDNTSTKILNLNIQNSIVARIAELKARC